LNDSYRELKEEIKGNARKKLFVKKKLGEKVEREKSIKRRKENSGDFSGKQRKIKIYWKNTEAKDGSTRIFVR